VTSEIIPVRLNLGALCARYVERSSTYASYTREMRADVDTRIRVLLAYFGSECVVRDLTPDEVASYSSARRAGGIEVVDCDERWITKAVRARSVVADLAVLHGMLNWALSRRELGARLLDANPIAGVRVRRDSHPRRRISTWDRFTATREAMQGRAAAASVGVERDRWVKAELALVLAEGTGRRLGAIRQLRWEDVDWDRATIRWRAESDKRRKEWLLPVPATLLQDLRSFQRRLGALGGWMLVSGNDPSAAMDRHTLAGCLEAAEAAAGLPKLDGGLFHPYRRKWATERKDRPLSDVAAAGGWQNTATLLTCYQQPTTDALLAVMNEPWKMRDVAAVGGSPARNG
jgi:integrase